MLGALVAVLTILPEELPGRIFGRFKVVSSRSHNCAEGTCGHQEAQPPH